MHRRPPPRPGEHVLHHDGTGDELRDAHADGGHAGLQGVLQDMAHKDAALFQAAGPGIEHIVLAHVFQHVVADQADIGGDIAQRHGEGRQDEAGKAAVAAGGQQVQPDADDPDEQQAHPVDGHGRGGKDHAAHDAVEPRVLVDGAQKTDGQAEHDDIDQREPGQFQGGRQTAAYLAQHRPRRIGVAHAQVEVQAVPEPVGIAHQKWLIQAQFRTGLGDEFFRDDGGLADAQGHLGRVGRDEVDEDEAQEGDAQQQGHGGQQAHDDVVFHEAIRAGRQGRAGLWRDSPSLRGLASRYFPSKYILVNGTSYWVWLNPTPLRRLVKSALLVS